MHYITRQRAGTGPFALVTLLAVLGAAAALSFAQSGRKERAVDTPGDKGAPAAQSTMRLSPPEEGVIPGAIVQRDVATGRILRVRGEVAMPGARTPEQAAERFLRANAEKLGIAPNLGDLAHVRSVASLTGHHVTYQQVLNGLPVLDGRVSVHTNKSLAVVLVNNGSIRVKGALKPAAPGNPEAAVGAALAAVKPELPPTVPPAAALAVFVQNDQPQLVWKVNIETRKPAGSWEILVSIPDGKVVRTVNRARFVDGDGMVFAPNPVNTSGDASLSDNDDQDSTTLTNQRVAVKLKDLDGTGYLQGPFCTTAPTDRQPRAHEPGLTFDYTRSDDRFEEVMCYYHIDTAQRYIQSLGFTNVNNRQQGINVNGTDEDNAWYSPWTGDITMGTGGVDDAEDAHVIWHEYGHAIQDNQVPGFGWSHEAGAMGEGFGDYWALTAFTGIGPNSPAWDVYVATWDATTYNPGNPAFLRRVDGTKRYPDDMIGQVHADGEIWSACLWQIRGIVGATRADTMILESHFRLAPDASFQDGALAILAANRDLYGGADGEAITQVFVDRGILVDPRVTDLSVVSIPARPGADVTLKATLTRRLDGTPLEGKEISFSVNGNPAGSAMTDANGVAELPMTVPADMPPGDYVLQADFAGDAEVFPAWAQGMLYVLETFFIAGTVTDSGAGMAGVPVILTAADAAAAGSPNAPIPDSDPNGVEVGLDVRSSGTVGDISVRVDIRHTWIGDLEVALIHPDGTTVLLHNMTGGSSDNIITTYPDQTSPAESLGVLKGKPIAGQWRLRVRDFYEMDTGTIRSWSLRIGRETPLVVNATTGPDGAYRALDLEPGTWRVVPDNGRSAFLPAFRNVAVGPSRSGVDFALNSFTIAGTASINDVPAEDVRVTITSPQDQNISYQDSPNLNIPDNNTRGIEAPIVIPDRGTITGIRVAVNITHTYIADLEVSLIHPDGTRIRLHNRTGGNRRDIITSYPDQTRPAESLSVLIGKPVTGTWKLRVRDLNYYDVGTLNSWGLDLAISGFADKTTTTGRDGAYAFADCIAGTHMLAARKDWLTFSPNPAIVVVGPHRLNVNFGAVGTRTVLTVPSLSGDRGRTVDLRAILRTSVGDPVANRQIAFAVNGNPVGQAITDALGVATLPYTIPSNATIGDAVIRAEFTGANPFLPATGVGTLTVKGTPVLLYAPNRAGVIGHLVYLRAYLYTAVGRNPLQGKTIAFEVNGTPVGTAATDSMGQASLDYVVAGPPGTYPLTFAFAGDADFGPGNTSATLTAQRLATSIVVSDRTARIASATTLQAFLYSQPGSVPLQGKSVDFSVDGTAAESAVTTATGRALLHYPIPDASGAGTRTVTASFAGEPGYHPVTGTATLTVNRAPVYVWVTARTIVRGQQAVLLAYVRRLPDLQKLTERPIAFSVEGTPVGAATTDDSGYARFTYAGSASLLPGTYGFTASFAGDAWIEPGSGSGQFRIVP